MKIVLSCLAIVYGVMLADATWSKNKRCWGISCKQGSRLIDAMGGGKINAYTLKGKCLIANGGYSRSGSFPSPDGCNSCTCNDMGTVTCTKNACQNGQVNDPYPSPAPTSSPAPTPSPGPTESSPVPADSPRGKCIIDNGGDLSTGRIPSVDGCNSCGCTDNGAVVCTLKGCPPRPKLKPSPSPAPQPSPAPETYPGPDYYAGSDYYAGYEPSPNPQPKPGPGSFPTPQPEPSPAPKPSPGPTESSSVPADSPRGECIIKNGGDLSTGRIPSVDGCNACGCTDKGAVVCTLKGCPPKPSPTPGPQLPPASEPYPKPNNCPGPNCSPQSKPVDTGFTLCRGPDCPKPMPIPAYSRQGACILAHNGDLLTGLLPSPPDSCSVCVCKKDGTFKCTSSSCNRGGTVSSIQSNGQQ